MFKQLTQHPNHIQLNNLFIDAGFELRFVGGCVRDSIIGINYKDVDFCTNATPEQMLTIPCKKIETGLQHGTITFIINNENYEVTTLRVDENCDGRHATTVYTTDWKEDANRRDLTINAMSVDFDGNLYDYFNGVEDLTNNKIQFVGDTEKRIKEDYLRILRYYRFILKTRAEKSLYDVQISQIIKDNVSTMICIVSKERIWDEMSKILSYNDPEFLDKVLKKMDDDGVLSIIGFKYLRNIYKFVNIEEYVSQMFSDSTHVIEFMKQYKCSNESINYASWLNKHTLMLLNDFDFNTTVDYFIHSILFKHTQFEWIAKGCEIVDNLKLFYSIKYKFNEIMDKTFPVDGNDLLTVGLTGKKIGDTLENMKHKWVSLSGNITKEELMKDIT